MPFLFKRAPQPTAGAQEYAHVSFAMPRFSLYGPGVPAGQLKVEQPPQMLHRHRSPLAGYGGIQHGQQFGQRLFNPATGKLLSSSYDPGDWSDKDYGYVG